MSAIINFVLLLFIISIIIIKLLVVGCGLWAVSYEL